MAIIGNLVVNVLAKTAAFNKAMAGMTKKMAKFGKKTIAIGKDFSRKFTMPIIAAFALATKAAATQEAADIALAQALKNVGDATKNTYESMKKYAAELQKVTTYGDEDTQMIMALGLNMGSTTNKVGEATKMAIGLAKAYNIDVKMAMRGVVLAMKGEFTLLNRYIPVLRILEGEQEKWIALQKAAADGFKMETAYAKTTAGALAQLKNTIGDAAESLGSAFLPHIKKAAAWLKNMAEKFQALTPAAQGSVIKIGLFVAVIGPALIVVGKLVLGLKSLIVVLGLIRAAAPGTAYSISLIGGAASIAALGILALASSYAKLRSESERLPGMLKERGIEGYGGDIERAGTITRGGATQRLERTDTMLADIDRRYNEMIEAKKQTALLNEIKNGLSRQAAVGVM